MAEMKKSEDERARDAVKVVSVWYYVGPIVLIGVVILFAIWYFATR